MAVQQDTSSEPGGWQYAPDLPQALALKTESVVVTLSLSLSQLEVNNNAITGGLDVLVAKCPSLSYLNLCGNKIKDLAALEALVRGRPPTSSPL